MVRFSRGSIVTWFSSITVLASAFFLSPVAQAEKTAEVGSVYFSSTYEQARNKFLQSAKAAGASIESYPHPLTGPDGRALYIDLAYLGPENVDAVLVLGSGTHGVEGFAGSAIQTGLLQEGIAGRIPHGVGLMMIHAINPYGFAHTRRVNEDNVDLNRNFLDHTQPYPENPEYEELARVAAPKSLSMWENLRARLSVYWYVLKGGELKLRKAISQGQYTHPKGLFFGGNKPAWSNVTLTEIIKRRLSRTKRVMVVDFHTGLGEYGEAEIIMNVPREAPEYERAMSCWGEKVRTTVQGESVSVDIRGPLKLAIPPMLPHTEVTAVSLEFGTVPVADVFWALRAENWLHHYGTDEHQDKVKIKAELLHVFYPDDIGWKRAVWRKGRSAVDEAMKCLLTD